MQSEKTGPDECGRKPGQADRLGDKAWTSGKGLGCLCLKQAFS